MFSFLNSFQGNLIGRIWEKVSFLLKVVFCVDLSLDHFFSPNHFYDIGRSSPSYLIREADDSVVL